MLSLAEMVERVPALYDAMRERDSKANLVCEMLATNRQCRQALEEWKRAKKKEKYLVNKAMKEARNESRTMDSVDDDVEESSGQ